MLVREAMTYRAETVGPEETLEAAARKMRDVGVGALAVCEEGRASGILTDRDIVVRCIAAGRNPAVTEVRSAMTAQLIECYEDEDLGAAATHGERGRAPVGGAGCGGDARRHAERRRHRPPQQLACRRDHRAGARARAAGPSRAVIVVGGTIALTMLDEAPCRTSSSAARAAGTPIRFSAPPLPNAASRHVQLGSEDGDGLGHWRAYPALGHRITRCPSSPDIVEGGNELGDVPRAQDRHPVPVSTLSIRW